LLCLAMFLASSEAAHALCSIDAKNYDTGGKLVKQCPSDINKLIDNEDLCYHLAGEISGDRSTDTQTAKELDKNHCGTVSFYCQRKKLLKKYEGRPEYDTIINALKKIYYYDAPNNEYSETMELMEKTECQKY
jgi:hypothetical protein